MIRQICEFSFFILGVIDSVSSECSMTSATVECLDQLGHGKRFKEPKQLDASKNVKITVEMGEVNYGWLNLKRRMYNGKISGPTITIRPGDTLNINLVNTLSADGNSLEDATTKHKFPNTTNLHTHGLHVSPKDPQDNALINVGPGENHRYSYQIKKDIAPGTHFYHTHVHGSTMFQVHSGLAGILIVEDGVANMAPNLAAASCPDNCDRDIQMLFQPTLLYMGGLGFGSLQNQINDYAGFKNDQYTLEQGGTLAELLSANLNKFTTNGQLEPELEIDIRQVYRFRMVNAGGMDTLELYIVDKDGQPTTDCSIQEIAYDGVYLDAPRAPHDGQSLLVSGGRVDWLVKCDVKGTYFLTSHWDPKHEQSIGYLPRYEGDLVKLTVLRKEGPTQKFPKNLPARPSYIGDLRSIDQSEIGGRFVLELNAHQYLNREHFTLPLSYRYKMKVGTVQEWHLLNADADVSHPIHIHVNHFQIVSYNEYTGSYDTNGGDWQLLDVKDRSPCLYQRNGYIELNRKKRSSVHVVNQATNETFLDEIGTKAGEGDPLRHLGHEVRYEEDAGNTLGYTRLGEWRDTVLVPSLSNITIRFVADEYVGDVIIHCHLLLHEDFGMMIITEIVDEEESTDANTPSGNAYPGTCRSCDRYPFNNPETLGDCDDNMVPT